MESQKKPVFKSTIFIIGISLVVLSALIFLLPVSDLIDSRQDRFFEIFVVNFVIAVLYMVILITNGLIKLRFRFFKSNIEYTLIFLVLTMISAFSLNREVAVFQQSVNWLCVLLVVQCITLLAFSFVSILPEIVKHVLYFFLGAGSILYLYFTIYLFPLYAFGLLAALFFGMSLHVFVPFLFLVFTIVLIRKVIKENRYAWVTLLSGAVVPLLLFIVFLIQWIQLKNEINYAVNKSLVTERNLPEWISISQQIEKSDVAEKMIKSDLVYSTPAKGDFFNWRANAGLFDEVKKHDPFVMTASFISGSPDIELNDRIKILKSIYDSRHQAQERLWEGEDLTTTNIISNVKIFPEYRMAYTEKTLSVKNNNTTGRNVQQEAIYTFHLPEGGVVTSLSLWINGREEKAILTAKSKADSAYKTIVGVQRRDPSLIHWQEGNTVSVRVFPCTPDENRRFKVGITAPLKKLANDLIYQNIYFDGPSGNGSTETIQLQFNVAPENIDFPFDFDETGNNTFVSEDSYASYWEIGMKAPALSANPFTFDSCSYKMRDYLRVFERFDPTTIYIDLNKSWEKNEFMNLWSAFKSKTVYVYQDQLVKVNEGNADALFESLSRNNFSLFPFYEINDSGNSLVVSKSTEASPNLRDVERSRFSERLKKYLKEEKQIRFFNISEEVSPYLKTLKELRVFNYDKGSVQDIINLAEKKQFVKNPENDSVVLIENAGIVIQKLQQQVATTTQAPDHLLRLFAYNDIMRKVGPLYFDDNFISEDIVQEAQKAYVVSPVSSLIVLETQEDYDRFDIKKSKNSLQNASLKSSGSVPEPHEWLLIILVASIVIYYSAKSWFARQTA